MQCQVEEDDVGVAVLFHLPLRQGELVQQSLHVTVVDERGEPPGKLPLTLCLIHHFRLAEVGDVVLTHLVHAVVQESGAFIPSQFAHLRSPFAHTRQGVVVLFVPHAPCIAHDALEQLQIGLIDGIVCRHLACPEETAVRHVRKIHCLLGGPLRAIDGTLAFMQCCRYLLLGQPRDSQLLRTAQDGRKQALRLVADQQEKSLLGRLFQNLEQFVGTSLVHALGQPDNHRLVPLGKRHQGQFAQYLAGLAFIDNQLLGLHFFHLGIEQGVPLLDIEIMTLQHHAPEQRQEIVAYGLVQSVRRGDGESKMQVGVLQLGKPLAGGALSAGVLVRAVRARQVLGIGNRQLQFSHTGRTAKQLRMRHTSLAHRLPKPLFDSLLTYYFLEQHVRFTFASAKVRRVRYPRTPTESSVFATDSL